MNAAARLRLARTHAQIFIWRNGWAWPAAFAMVLAAGALYASMVLPDRAALATVQSEFLLEAKAAPRTAPAAASESEKLESFQKLLRGAPSASEALTTMAALAKAQQIALAQGDYQQQKHPVLPIASIQVSQPLRASYPQLRRYVESTLLALPHASLDQITARRENIGQSQLEVRLRWTLWSAGPAPAAAAQAPADKAP